MTGRDLLERQVIGGLLLAGASGPKVASRIAEEARVTGLRSGDFQRQTLGRIYAIQLDLIARGDTCDVASVSARLNGEPEFSKLHSGGPTSFLSELLADTTTFTSTAAHARRLTAERETRFDLGRAVDGATFLEAIPSTVPAVWGEPGGAIAWAKGEPVMLVGPDGVGKSSLGQQLALARIGLGDQLLGMPVEEAPGRVLYVAADRPRQAGSSLRRMVEAEQYDVLRERLVVWKGPLPFDIAIEPRALEEFIRDLGGISDVVIDSLKDVATDLSKDETGSRVNIAFQLVIAAGVELCVLHHQRKEGQQSGKPKRISDVYGSRWLTAGTGSVLLLWGEPGDLVVELRHLKQPVEEVGPLSVRHDHANGSSTVLEQADLETALANARHGLLVKDAAELMFETTDPKPNEIEKARRRLESLVGRDRVERRDDPDGLARYFVREQP